MIVALKFNGTEVGSIYGTMGLASLFMPALLGIIADRWVNAERVLGMCHIIGAALLFSASKVTDHHTMYWIMLLNSMMFMPTIALNNTVSYIVLEQRGFNIVKDFPPIRVWGTIGFVCAMWLVDLCGWTISPLQRSLSANRGAASPERTAGALGSTHAVRSSANAGYAGTFRSGLVDGFGES